MNFEHRHAAHCESGVVSALLTHYGLPMSEAFAFGLSGGITFAYVPIVKVANMPLIAYRMPPKSIISKRSIVKTTLQTQFEFKPDNYSVE